MEKRPDISSFTAADIERYHKGLLTSAEMHAMEKAALEDPFLADAMEGYLLPGLDIPADLADLKNRLSRKTEETPVISLAAPSTSRFSWWKIAAMLIVIAGAGMLTYQIATTNKKDAVAVSKQPSEQTSISPAENYKSKVAPDSLPIMNEPAQQKMDIVSGNDQQKDKVNELVVTDDKKLVEPPAAAPVLQQKKEPVAENVVADDPEASLLAKKSTYSENRKEKQVTNVESAESKSVPRGIVANSNTRSRTNQGYLNNNVFRGRITDQQNNAVPFANITNPVDNVGTYADASGNFTLTSPDSVLNVQVRSLGYQNNTIALKNNVSSNRIYMQEDHSLNARVLDTVKRNANRVRNSTMVLEEPEPADGWSNYDTYLSNNLNIPENFKPTRSSSAEVELSFEVNKLGEPVNIRVEKSLCETCDREAIRLVKEGPKWKRKARKNRTRVTVAF